MSAKKAGSVKKVIIRSDSNIIGHFENVIVKEKRNNKLFVENSSSDDNDVNSNNSNKKSSKIFDDNPSHTVSFSGTGNSRHNIISSSYIADNEMNNYLSKAYSKSMPATMNYNIMNADNVDILENYEPKKNPEEINNIFIDSSSNGNINYNDFLFSDDENIENGEQSNVNHEVGNVTVDTKNENKETKKKVKTNNKNVTL